MTKQITYDGTFNQSLLMDELLAAFPGWLIGEGEERQCLLYLDGNDQGVRLTVPDDAIEEEINVVVTAHNPDELSIAEVINKEITDSYTGFRNIPNWAPWTPREAEDFVHSDILNGMTKAEVEVWIDANVTTLATARNALKLIGGELIDLRNICEKLALSVMYLRNIIVR